MRRTAREGTRNVPMSDRAMFVLVALLAAPAWVAFAWVVGAWWGGRP